MTDVGNEPLTPAQRLAITVVLAGVAVFMTADAIDDFRSGGTAAHLALELLLALAAAAGLVVLWTRYLRIRSGLTAAQERLASARAEAERWRAQNDELLRGLSAAIDRQLAEWRLTGAEKEVCFLLLKGLSFKEIAAVRGASERTVRAQALAVYAKSGLGGRAELAAFFLEDLLAPPSPVS